MYICSCLWVCIALTFYYALLSVSLESIKYTFYNSDGAIVLHV